MAGDIVTFINPGYSTLYVKDLPYTVGTGEDPNLNPFQPSSSRPLIEGEWLQFGANYSFTRGGDNAVGSPGVPDNEGTVPSFIYFQERGRYDAQSTKMAHCVIGPAFFEFDTRLCVTAGLNVGDLVSVWDLDTFDGRIRRGLAAHSAGWAVGRVSRILGTNHIRVIYGLQ